jgi:3-oxoacyl-[acyl-carrier-protein] synthase II
MSDQVVITGVGVITPLGNAVSQVLSSVRAGTSAVAAPSCLSGGPFAALRVAEVRNFQPADVGLDGKILRIMSRDAVFAAAAAKLAIRDAGVKIGTDYAPEQVGLFGATGLSGIAFEEVSQLVRHSARPDGTFDPQLFGEVALKRILPTLSFKILTNMPMCFISIFENIQGVNAIYNPWEGQGGHAVLAGVNAIRDGDAECCLVGGCEVKTSILGLISLHQHGLLEVAGAGGVIPAEGAAFLVLEKESRARARDARMYAVIEGCMQTGRREMRPGCDKDTTILVRSQIDTSAYQKKAAPKRDRRGPLAEAQNTDSSFVDALHAEMLKVDSAHAPMPSVAAPCADVILAGTPLSDGPGADVGLADKPLVDVSCANKPLVVIPSCGPAATATGNWQETLDPKAFLGDAFAAAAPLQVALAAEIVRQGGGCAVAESGGAGSEQGAFRLRSPNHRVDEIGDDVPRRHRVVVTGIGMVSPIGSGREIFWQNALNGVSGLGPVTLFDARALSVRIAGEVKHFDVAAAFAKPGRGRPERDRKIALGLAAADEALNAAGLGGDSCGILASATLHVGVSLEVFFLDDVTPIIHAPDLTAAMAERFFPARELAATQAVYAGCDLQALGAEFPLQTPLDRLSDLIGDSWGIFGGRTTICSACAAGAQVIGEALRALQAGRTQVAVAGAADSMINPLGMGGFSLLRALSTENDHPAGACRPFDATRLGTVLGEGAAFLVLETLDHARSRGATILAELLGYGSSLDAYRVSDPEPGGRGAILSMKKALESAGLEPGQIDAVNAHGTGTPKNDAVETLAIKTVLGSRAREIPVHALKSMTGHLIAASGAVEAACAVMTIERAMIPPTMNLCEPDPECDLDYVPLKARAFAGRTVLSNSFGFGGQNATLIFRRFEG